MDRKKTLATQFEGRRAHLRAVAYRMLGSLGEADDAVQEAWLRLSRSDESEIGNLGGWLTTVVARVCLDMLRKRKARREEPLDVPGPTTLHDSGGDPEEQAMMADSVGLALMVVLERLAPAERIAFVLHDAFDMPFEEIAPIVGRSPEAARQLASRARRRVRGTPVLPQPELARQRTVVDAYLAAARTGDFEGLIAILDPDVVLRVDPALLPAGAPGEFRGAANVTGKALAYSGRAWFSSPALIDGAVGIIVAPNGRLLSIVRLTFVDAKITEMEMISSPKRLRAIDLAALGSAS
jgi:RNA polymerase sigma-70 factor, ECF subfamily